MESFWYSRKVEKVVEILVVKVVQMIEREQVDPAVRCPGPGLAP